MLARITNNLIIVVFGFLLRDYLTPITLVIIGLGFIQSVLNIRIPKMIKNLISLIIFSLFVMSIRKFANPEGWLNFLTSFLVLKTFEKNDSRDYYITFMGMILILGVGSLFEKDIVYFTFFLISSVILIKNFYTFTGYKTNFKRMGGVLLFTLPFLVILFLAIPRSMTPINIGATSNIEGKIGYTPDVNLENIVALSGNQTPVFQAMLSRFMELPNLYWRGNVLNITDGWNWPLGTEGSSQETFDKRAPLEDEIVQNIRLHNYQENFFGLDFPKTIAFEGKSILLNEERTLRQHKSMWKNTYEVISNPGQLTRLGEDNRNFLRVPISRELKELIRKRFQGNNFSELLTDIETQFTQEKFAYSLSPGRVTDIADFFEKKIGFCSHYASAVAIILRVKGIPTRLVSGFLGGQYNEFGNFYLITQNDAHVWLEALSDGKWQRVDPTEWVAPNRVNLSGQDFISTQENPGLMGEFLRSSSRLKVVTQWFEQWNFSFYQWIDKVDYFSQLEFLEKLNLKREFLYGLTFGAIIVFTLLYTLFFARNQERKLKGIQKMWSDFLLKTNTQAYSVQEMQSKFEIEKNELALNVLNELTLVSFNNQKISKSLLQKIRRL